MGYVKMRVFLSSVLLTATFANEITTFEQWLDKFERNYESDAERANRRAIWNENYEIITIHNLAADHGAYDYRLAVNNFSDLTKLEWRSKYLSPVRDDPKPVTKCTNWTAKGVPVHDTKDWHKGKHVSVTRVKDQGQCGSCWAFASTGTIEGAWARKINWSEGFELDSFAEQQIVDCSTSYNNQGCMGGHIDAGVTYAMDHGLESESSYRYWGSNGKCKYDETKVVAKPDECFYVAPKDEKALKEAVDKYGPVAISINAGDDFQHYDRGVFYGMCSSKASDANHGVLITGYGKDYWIVKNSWGEEGYIKFKYDRNACGLAMSRFLRIFISFDS